MERVQGGSSKWDVDDREKQEERACTTYRMAQNSADIYECRKCGNRFLSLEIKERVSCPECEAEIDYEIGPDESLEDLLETADLKQKIEGEEEVEKMDALLSLAVTGGDFEWI